MLDLKGRNARIILNSRALAGAAKKAEDWNAIWDILFEYGCFPLKVGAPACSRKYFENKSPKHMYRTSVNIYQKTKAKTENIWVEQAASTSSRENIKFSIPSYTVPIAPNAGPVLFPILSHRPCTAPIPPLYDIFSPSVLDPRRTFFAPARAKTLWVLLLNFKTLCVLLLTENICPKPNFP